MKDQNFIVYLVFVQSGIRSAALLLSVAQVARSLVSETHRVLHESRLITLLPKTIHTDLSWP